jgi:arsenical pump membrane protein
MSWILSALARGIDVYCFLAGMMLLAEFAKIEGAFDWLAARAVRAARGSRSRLFALVYGVGILTTALLSNDATIVVLTPAVIAALARIEADKRPYLLACAFVANAASFVLPIANPSNLLVFARHMPPLATWLRWTALPSLAAIVATYAVLSVMFRRVLAGAIDVGDVAAPQRPRTFAVVTLLAAAAMLVGVSSAGGPLGFATLACALVALVIAAAGDRGAPLVMIRETGWSVIALTAGMFVVVAAIDDAGALQATRALFEHGSPAVIGAAVALASNVFNNLPVGLNVGEAVEALHPPAAAAFSALIGINLGPNLAPNASLATILWLAILRRSGVAIGPLGFLRAGALVTPPALVAALLCVR